MSAPATAWERICRGAHVCALRRGGATTGEVAAALGLTKQRVSKIAHAYGMPRLAPARPREVHLPDPAVLRKALRESRGNVRATARALGFGEHVHTRSFDRALNRDAPLLAEYARGLRDARRG